MGSWNETCAVSRLPILSGDKVVGVLLANMNKAPRFNPASSWAPVGLPVYGAYDDYGGIEDVVWGNLDKGFWIEPEGVLENLVQLNQGENPYHDCPMSFDEIKKKGWEALQEASREERFVLNVNRYTKPLSGIVSGQDGKDEKNRHGSSRCTVVLAQIHRHVWDALMQAAPEEARVEDTLNRLQAYRNERAVQQKTWPTAKTICRNFWRR